MTPSMIAAALALLIVFWATGAYQRLSRQRKQCRTAFSQVDAQAQRRHELIPSLADTMRRYMPGERAALEAALAADNAAVIASVHASRSALDAAAMAQLGEAEAALESALGKLFAQAQRYPDLPDDQEMRRLIDELSGVASRMAFARQVYNEAANQYNAARTQFPGSVIAFVFAFPPVAALPPAGVQQHS